MKYPFVHCLICCLWAVSSWFVQRASLTININLSDVTNEWYIQCVAKCRIDIWEKIINNYCSVVTGKSQPLGSTILGKPHFQLECRAHGFGFPCPHWRPMMDSSYVTYLYQPIEKIKKRTATHPPMTSLQCKMTSQCRISANLNFLDAFFHVFPV